MLLLACEPLKDNNYLLHSFLRTELGNAPDERTLKSYAPLLFPDYLVAEQPEKAVQTIRELYDWTTEPYVRRMRPIHELALFNFFMLWREKIENEPDVFREQYFDDRAREIVRKLSEEMNEEAGCDNAEDYFYADMNFYVDTLLLNLDFLLPTQWNSVSDPTAILESLRQSGADIRDYLELVPEDARELYGDAPFEPCREMPRFLQYGEHVAKYGAWGNLLWNEDLPAPIGQIGSLVDELLHEYFSDHVVQTETCCFTPDSLEIEIVPENGSACFLDLHAVQSETLSEPQQAALASAVGREDPKSGSPESAEIRPEPVFHTFFCFSDGAYAQILKFLEDSPDACGRLCVIDCRRQPSRG